MATITTLAIKVALNVAGYAAGAKLVAAGAEQMAGSVRASNATMNESAGVYDKLNASAGGYLKTILGVAGAGAMVAHAVKAAAAADPTKELSTGYERLTSAVTKAYETFGTAFARSADLNKTMDLLRGAVQSVTSVLSVLGSIAGAVFGWFVNTPPVFLAAAVALKAVAIAAVFLANVMITRLILGMATYLLLGTAMSPMTLGMAAAKLAWAAAMFVASGAAGILTAAMGLLMAVGLPVWAAIAVVVLALAAAIGVVVGITYLLIQAWKAFTGPDKTADRIANMEAFAKATDDARKAVVGMQDALDKQIRQHGMSAQAKELDDFIEKLNNWQNIAAANGQDIHEAMLVWLADFQASQAIAAKQAADDEKRKARLERMKSLQNELNSIAAENFNAGTSDLDKRLAKLQQMGASSSQLDWARQSLEMADAQNRAAENRRSIEQEITNLQKEAAQAGMTDAEKRLDNLKRIGATAAEIAAAQSAMATITAAQEKKRLADQGKAMKDATLTPLEQYQKKIGEIENLLKTGTIDPITAMRAADAAQKSLDSALPAGSRESSSPKALLRGSADAELAENRAKNPIEQLTAIQKQHLDEAKRARVNLDALAAAARNPNNGADDVFNL